MSKVIAIIEKPKDCYECVFGICKYSTPLTTRRKGYYCQLKEPKGRVVEDFDYDESVHLSNCPLKEVPERKEMDSLSFCDCIESTGYNACIDEILGGSKNE